MNTSSDTAPSGHEIARLWSQAPALLPHSSGCACAGHVALHLDPRAVEEDILEHLMVRYVEQPELAAFIAARARARGIGFAGWLAAIDTAPLSAEAAARLKTDLHATIASLAGARPE